jgi:cell division protein FtsQ
MIWKKIVLVTFNIVLAAYLVLAMLAFNKPDRQLVCKGMRITIEEGIVDGFLTKDEVKRMLVTEHLSPIGQSMEDVNLRLMEESLESKELIEEAECYKAQDSVVCIDIRQRIPVIRVINAYGEDYYVDSHGKAMPHADYSCHLIVATGNVSKQYAEKWLAPMANIVLKDKFWKSQIVQLNVLSDGSVEMVPRVGEHIVYLGQPTGIAHKLERLRKFYRYGLSQAGWNKYSRVSVEFDNQIICKRNNLKKSKKQ